MVKLLVMYSNEPPSPEHIRHLSEMCEGVTVVVADSEAAAIHHAPDTDVILGHRYLHQTLPHTKQLKWVQSTAAGVDHLISSDLLTISPILTRCPIFSDIVALHAFTLALAVLRRIPEAVIAQQQGELTRAPLDMLPIPKTAMIFGIGSIGSELAKILHQHGLTVLGVARNPTSKARKVCDELLTPNNWQQNVHRADLFFITLPLNKSTRNLFDKSVLKLLPSHAVLVNISRGEIVDTDALVNLLCTGQLGGAALDVIDPLPKSPEDPIWKTPHLLITPKVSVFYPERQRKLEGFIENQVKRYLNGEKLLYTVNLDNILE